MPHLENWELIGISLRGIVTGHHRIEDGKDVRTSPILELDLNSKKAVTRSGTHYTLGEMSDNYKKYIEDRKQMIANKNCTDCHIPCNLCPHE